MYQGMYGMLQSCRECGHRFEPSQGEFTGGLLIAQGGFGVLAAAGYFFLWVQKAPRWIGYAWLGFVLILLPILFYPNIKGAWLGFLHGVRASR